MGTAINNIRILLGFCLGYILLAGCSEPRDPILFSTQPVTQRPDGVTAYFDRDVQQVLNRSCVGGCHEQEGSGQRQAGLVLTSDVSYGELLDPTASKNGPHVIPGNPDQSLLIWKLEGKDAAGRRVFGEQMPLGRPALSGDEIAAIRAWIQEGALRSIAPPVPPSVLSAASLDSTGVEVVFSEVVDPVSAAHAGNYSVTEDAPLEILGVVLDAPDRVRLITAPQVAGVSYTVVVRNVKDGTGDAIRPGVGDTVVFRFTPEISFTLQIQPVFTQSCAFVGCHGASDRFPPGAGLVLDSGVARENLVGRPSQEQQTSVLVLPEDPDRSYLIRKLEGTAGVVGDRMPQGGPYLTPSQMVPFRLWVEQGALDN